MRETKRGKENIREVSTKELFDLKKTGRDDNMRQSREK